MSQIKFNESSPDSVHTMHLEHYKKFKNKGKKTIGAEV